MLFANSFQFIFAPFADSIKNMNKQITKHIKHFVVVLVDHHFHIETGEFTQVTACVGIFCSEHRSGLEYTFESRTCSRHLLVQLGRHSQTGWLPKVIQFENFGTTLGSSSNQFRSMNFNKSFFDKAFTEKDTNHGLNAENCLIGGCSQIDPSVVETDFLPDANQTVGSCLLCFFFCIVSTNICFLYQIRTASVFHEERQCISCFTDTVELCDLNLH
mmetsp:Transcript_15256/g.23215  ORF Transcript_15256/g.23215 Transcript_15256/m.23215 type:complete len:216 (-) Transcript_15256:927-1574(-)